MKDYYSVLGVPRSASIEEVHASYRRHALRHHPDRNPEVSDTSRFREIQEAYEVIGQPDRRRDYDQRLDHEEARGEPRRSVRREHETTGSRVWRSEFQRPHVWPKYGNGWASSGGEVWPNDEEPVFRRVRDPDHWGPLYQSEQHWSDEFENIAARLRSFLFDIGNEWSDR